MQQVVLDSAVVPSASGGLTKVKGAFIYLIGIGGTGMSAVARLLMEAGCRVYGSDLQLSPAILSLEEKGARITLRQDGSWLSPQTDLVVISAAIEEDNPDLATARRQGLRVVKYSQALGSLMREKLGIAVSGTHGKTTTAAMISTILREAKEDPTFVIGGEVSDLGGSSGLGHGRFFVAEACEYDRSFLNLCPHIAVITNIEEDHLDYYHSLEGIIGAFKEFVSRVPKDGLVVASHEDPNIPEVLRDLSCKVETYSLLPEADSDWRATPPVLQGGLNRFDVYYHGRHFGRFGLRVPGRHNVLNALAAIAVCHHAGVEAEAMKEALRHFKGANRRFQVLGKAGDITVVDDYAHHPTEISATLVAAREVFPRRRLWCVFQPHQYNRTRRLLGGFATSLRKADSVVLTDIYPARDNLEDIKSISSLNLLAEVRHLGARALYVSAVEEVARKILPQLCTGDVVMTMGAGNIWQSGVELLSLLRNRGQNGRGSIKNHSL
ncbi:MAG: UDP-N-acetylmuramate--L-alanine ligase [Candidatus Brocadiales bacterium]|nr:UDP-N-acetylmuramate--L-alanine ligase [Candidatus Brocadiales bacterium]